MAQQVPIRRCEPAPDDAAVVIRAGVMAPASLKEAAERTLEQYGVLGISVEGVIDIGVADACRTSRRLRQYGMIRLSTFGRVRRAGFALIATFDHPHFTLLLPDVSELTLARLTRCFDDPIPNPARSGRS